VISWAAENVKPKHVLIMLALLVFVCYSIILIEYTCFLACASIARLRVPVKSDFSGYILVFMHLLCWGVSIIGFCFNIFSSNYEALLCNVFPLGMCSYAVGLPAVFMCTPIFYKKSNDLTCALFKAIPVSLLSAATYCYMMQHPHGSGVMPRMQGIQAMPYAIVLPLLPPLKTWYESYFDGSGEKIK
jgi:hypothetical protein